MLGKILRLLIRFNLYSRYVFWKVFLRMNGGSLGKNVKIYEGVKLASHRECPITIGDHVSIEKGVVISTSQSGKISIGNNVYIGEYSVLASNKEIEIGNNVLISPHNSIIDFNHIYEDTSRSIYLQGLNTKKITIQEDVWLGSGSKILMGVTIGKGAVIGAGSIVTKDVPPFHVVAGNPAKTIKVRGG